ncbi:hypothetical protein TNIN_325781 [Trichonephila inaurata madagascariensis]|uniref:Uncharacterized protein n=1 Tax=Trichonephila inaurata madagascariensis TaxID=2747483 RepID=A0A8X6YH53_9ARAC|nr:hypothetical protein TNIN_325781 [Trichonephila inaurata madagascariensis]
MLTTHPGLVTTELVSVVKLTSATAWATAATLLRKPLPLSLLPLEPSCFTSCSSETVEIEALLSIGSTHITLKCVNSNAAHSDDLNASEKSATKMGFCFQGFV